MSEKVQMKYLGKNDTLVRLERSGEKVEVKSGDVVEVDRDLAVQFAKTYKNIWVSANSKAVPKSEEAQIEGGVDENEIEKAVPKKAKKA